MIDCSTLAGLLEHDHRLAAYCPRCDRWAALPLAELVAEGKGLLRLPVTVRCRDCGERGTLQVRPPVPTRGPGGWGEVPADDAMPGVNFGLLTATTRHSLDTV
jgi:hypothetical protein